ncbi:hypothetical protein JST97_35960 [bacterium]|nr:hypothetical protein [bacterium]
MKVSELLSWIENECDQEEVALELLEAAEAELLATDPDGVDPRVERISGLLAEPLDFQQLEDLLQDWSRLSDQAESLKLEAEFRRISRTLTSEEWQTNLFSSLVHLHRDFEAGLDPHAVVAAADYLFEKVAESRQDFLEMPITEEEITAETVLGHQLLNESFDLWQNSLEMVADAVEQPELWDDVLKAGQQASRRLVTVQLLDQRVQASVCRY